MCLRPCLGVRKLGEQLLEWERGEAVDATVYTLRLLEWWLSFLILGRPGLDGFVGLIHRLGERRFRCAHDDGLCAHVDLHVLARPKG